MYLLYIKYVIENSRKKNIELKLLFYFMQSCRIHLCVSMALDLNISCIC